MQYTHAKSERGFVLATALIMLSLLSLMAIAMYFTGRASVHVSSGAQHSTEGHYFAETAVNYMIWAMRNDAEFDSFSYGGVAPFGEPPVTPTNAATVGDWSELMDNLSDPGPTAISDSTAAGTSGQVMYYDNSPLYLSGTANRAIIWPLPTSGGNPVYPTMYNISASLPRFIRLDIDSAGNVTPSIPALPHIASPATDGSDDIPENGAIAWLTTGNSATDFELDPTLAVCTALSAAPLGAVACDKGTGNWLLPTGTIAAGTLHGIVVYAIGYVGGRPSSIIRAQIK
ncbi:MAG: hypothetical protein COW19_00770 [Zetaproteobacteria bacterium CG12_big_fil_rev_8_21_14_0_65_55_1124]|nr:MAG: hypothetical protein AUJ58_11035 [Zetaproteobacteria bacterium CG1_02_55_237]PIS19154.1 MAG: hypothetical protein COT53_07105 [Zetaproteobacteria bacterium CG08_land_8_20_14_0_20_55_17]PIW43850.1 MAG: hypothetical protein COW19_00770 [Zetaproteobacteria bacterium CG12_big_fil_rev_8_21_14_0_65_55_1124]PIY52995.1 MAG: hypothetical protein COZ01_05510 [Zetaproteobacteria bacterium CG_4_10_14_0_8_um_filter_55_43]PIZ37629.1 MAG: hypothetical protein COY36_08710 [Zetaproteobacteria bacterium 